MTLTGGFFLVISKVKTININLLGKESATPFEVIYGNSLEGT
jgi:hypothetical protein